jgi:hypothetical protein
MASISTQVIFPTGTYYPQVRPQAVENITAGLYAL